MSLADFTTEELTLVARALDTLADMVDRASLEGHVLAAASDIVRGAVRARTLHDPLPGQTALTD